MSNPRNDEQILQADDREQDRREREEFERHYQEYLETNRAFMKAMRSEFSINQQKETK